MFQLFNRITKQVSCKPLYGRLLFEVLNSPVLSNPNASASSIHNDDYEPGIGSRDELSYFPSKKVWQNAPDMLKKEIKLWTEEQKEKWKNDPIFFYNPGEIYKVFTFSNEDHIKQWACTSDQMVGFGYSTCTLTRNNNGHALFSGTLSTAVKDDGKTYRSGFCSIRSPRAVKSFGRKSFYDWSQYTHLVMKVRGDGRAYVINLGYDGFFDMNWYNLYSYFLFTRGGPYWQIAKIPFSKFILGHRGHIQDKQQVLEQDEIRSFGVTICDDIDAPFQLEIDYIGLEVNGRHFEESAYESYNVVPKPFWTSKS